ncbi:MAG TPA: cellulase family glycosylhydrolase [Acidimicrobiales bacterium]|nr:cellulase family glycosylhydrolase [Acidimicrobiales bacterium]
MPAAAIICVVRAAVDARGRHGRSTVAWFQIAAVTIAVSAAFVAAPGASVTATSSPTTQVTVPGPVASPAPEPRVSGNALVDQYGRPLRLLGVDASGTEDACVEHAGFSYGPSNASEAIAIASWHANAVRVPLNEDCWLGINGVPAQYSGAAYQAGIVQWVQAINHAGMVAILDLHWSAPGSIEAGQQWPMPDEDHSVTFWSEVAATFAPDPSVLFDLFNEPSLGKGQPTQADWSCWLTGCTLSFDPGWATFSYQSAGMQQLLDAVRSAGAHQPVIVGGLNWAGDPCGIMDSAGNGGKCDWTSWEPQDPEHQLIVAFHTYNTSACTTVACWDASVLPVAGSVPVVTTEIGEDDCSANYIDTYMQWADEHNISYLAWSWQPAPAGATCVSNPWSLLANWGGAPSTIVPAGPAFASHLNSVWSATSVPSTTASTTPPTTTIPPKTANLAAGYWLATRHGPVYAIGAAPPLGDAHTSRATGPVVGIAASPHGRGYWVVTADGVVANFGSATFYGDLSTLKKRVTNVVAIAPTSDGNGYYLVTANGGLFTFGDATFRGSLPDLGTRVSDVVDMVSTPGGSGYLMVGSNGAVFSFGRPHLYGSLPKTDKGAYDIRGMALSSTGRGYVLVSANGGVFIFGSGIAFHGSLPSEHVSASDIVGIALSPDDGGYDLAASDGRVYSFGDTPAGPGPSGLDANLPVVAITGT